jgi:hypothetical protein
MYFGSVDVLPDSIAKRNGLGIKGWNDDAKWHLEGVNLSRIEFE